MARKPIVEAYQPRPPSGGNVTSRTYVPRKPEPSKKPDSGAKKPISIIVKPTVNKT